MPDTPLAALVMAGGLGTRMKSAVPKHFHPILGRRMVDWVIETGRASGADPLVVVASPAGARRVRRQRRHDRGSGDAARHRRRRARRARGARRPRRRRARALRRHAAADAPSSSSDSSRRITASRPRPRSCQRRAARRARLRPDRPRRPTAPCCGSPKEPTRPTTSSAIREINSSIYVFRADALWPALEQLQPKNVQGELYLTDAIEILVAAGEKVAAHVADDSPRDGRREHARRARAARARSCATASTSSTCSRGVTIVDPATTWIEPTVELEPDVVVQPFTVSARRHAGRRRRRDRREHRRDRHARRSLTPSSAPSVTFAPERSSASLPRRAPSWRSRTRRSATAPRCPISRTSETPTSARTRTSAQARSPPTSRTSPGQPKGRTTIGSNVRTAIQNGFVAPVTIGDGAWIGAGSVITKDVPPDALAIARPRQENKEGYAARQRGD